MNRPALLSVLTALTLLASAPLRAQDGADFRVGISVGGVSTVGLVFESEQSWGSLELILGTWSFRDVSVSTVYKRYFGGGAIKGAAGLGFWTVVAFPSDERTGLAFVARAPVGLQWEAQTDHFLNLELGLSRAIAIRRTDPDDEMPPNHRIVPLPGASYRWRSR